MFQLDDQFLQSVGLGDLPEEQKEAFLQHTYETLEERVGTRLANDLTDTQLEEFEAFATQDEAKVYGWLNANAPDYQNQPEYQELRKTAPADIAPLVIAAEFASVKWLEVNSPNYREVVSQELNKLRDEIVASKAQIGGSGQQTPPSSQPTQQ